MYKSHINLLYRRLSLALMLLVAACGNSTNNDGSESGAGGNGNYHEESLETGSRTQNINNEDRDASYSGTANTQAPTYNSEDTGLARRRMQQLDSMNANDKKQTGPVTGKK